MHEQDLFASTPPVIKRAKINQIRKRWCPSTPVNLEINKVFFDCFLVCILFVFCGVCISLSHHKIRCQFITNFIMCRDKSTVQRREAVRRGTQLFLNEQRLMIDELTNFIRDICVDLDIEDHHI
jgi:hypothetical protein